MTRLRTRHTIGDMQQTRNGWFSYRLVDKEPHTNRWGHPTVIQVWRGTCCMCGAPFVARSGREASVVAPDLSGASRAVAAQQHQSEENSSMNTDIGSNRLAVLASEIRQAHASAEAAAIEHATRALEAGRALIEAKSLVKHGQWLPWLREVGISSRSASRYMRLVKSGTGIGHVADLGIRATDEALAKQMPETDADELPPPE